MEIDNRNNKPRPIAFYLPQYYPTQENDEWWQKGFTEWTNVGKAKPLFKGHYQPRVPADLGYYDLRVTQVREEQAELAKQGGIEGFCYWHYWFSGKRLLDRVFSEVVESKTPNFPFCLCWANHSWYAKTWQADIPDKLLIEQTYGGKSDYENHFNALHQAFKDERYIKVNAKLLFVVWRPLDLPEPKVFMEIWNELALKNGLNGFYFVGFSFFQHDIQAILDAGYDAVTYEGLYAAYEDAFTYSKKLLAKLKGILFKIPECVEYDFYTKHFIEKMIKFNFNTNILPSILPNFDHSPRSGHWGRILINSTPAKWGKFCEDVFKICANRNQQENIVFLKAWNEWGEGNYLEPDLKYGVQYIDELWNAYNNY